MDYEAQRDARRAALQTCNEACETGNFEQFKHVFQSGQLSGDDARGFLVWTLEEDDLAMARCILELGVADLNVRPTQLLEACQSPASLKLLAEFGLDFPKYGHNVLHTFVNDRDTLSWLLDQGVDPNLPLNQSLIYHLKKGEHDRTVQVLNQAASQGDIDTFDYLVSRGADASRSIALHRATRCLDPEKVTAMVDHLIAKYHFDPNADDDCGGIRHLVTPFPEEGPPLAYAIANENRAAAVALLKNGAEPQTDMAEELQRLLGSGA